MAKSSKTRTEKDSLGQLKVPADAYFGIFTTRALGNFQISNMRAPAIFRRSLGLVKSAAAQANTSLKQLEPRIGKIIIKAAEEFAEGKFDTDFRLDVIQAGAGTPFNMNANEIIANRANVSLKAKLGTNKPIHPNNHVNLGQSSNDVNPSTTKVAILLQLPALLTEAKKLEKSLATKASQFKSIKKVGRTHLQDAVPIPLGQEFDAYSRAITRSRTLIEKVSEDLYELSLGGTAVGTGILAHPKFKKTIVANLSKLTGLKLKSAQNLTEAANNYMPFSDFSSTLTSLSSNLFRIAMDLKFLGSGPNAGLAELKLPTVQPGSSIMPGKVNPSIPESVEMAHYQVSGNHETVRLAAMHGQLELNSNCPIIMYNILQSIEILTNICTTFRTRCIDGLTADKKRIKELYDNSLCEATALVPKLGYDKVAEMVKKGKL
jgi:aspartate ammonia-lyase